jgi:hypothetical protein
MTPKESSLTFQQTLGLLFHEMKRAGKRKELESKIGKSMYSKLCVLGFITEGSTIDPETKERIRVWKVTNKPNLFDKIAREQSEQEVQFLNRQIEFSL